MDVKPPFPNKAVEFIVGQTTDELQYLFQLYLTKVMAISQNLLEEPVPTLGGLDTAAANTSA